MAALQADPTLLAVSRGDAPADLVLANARLVNVITCEVLEGVDIAIACGRIAGVGSYRNAKAVDDLNGQYLLPGFIDAHMHVESTMMPPSRFVMLALPHGTTAAVFDPHEIANVLGVSGIRYIMNDSCGLPFTSLFSISSCVPSSPLETSGAVLDADDLAPLFDDERVVALAEMMNYPGALNALPAVITKINLGLRRHLVDGHAPGLTGRALNAYIAAGISSDHECTTLDEAREKLRLGQRIFIREGSAARNLAALMPLVTVGNKHRFCFCTDDRHPGDLAAQGHIDHVVREAIAAGMDPLWAIAIGSFHAAEHYRRDDLGAVVPGRRANLIVCDDLAKLLVRRTYHEGMLVARDGAYCGPSIASLSPPAGGGVRLEPVKSTAPLDVSRLAIRAPMGAAHPIRIIVAHHDQIVTGEMRALAKVEDGFRVADVSRDILKLAVIERHLGTGRIGLGFVHGFGLHHGAIASTVGHDAHNLAVVGTNDADMLLAARTLEACGGGQCVIASGDVRAVLPLPIAGLMSDQPPAVLIAQQAKVLSEARLLGYAHADPFMPLSFIVLPVIPALKLTDLGLIDVAAFAVVPMEVSPTSPGEGLSMPSIL